MPRKTHPLPAAPPRTRGDFNEAAARCRGKQGRRSKEDPQLANFNEAAARCRGKPGAGVGLMEKQRHFNEAAARCRGKLAVRPRPAPRPRTTSMRPRLDAAENVVPVVLRPDLDETSMRPRLDAAENAGNPPDRLRGRVLQ